MVEEVDGGGVLSDAGLRVHNLRNIQPMAELVGHGLAFDAELVE